MVAFAGLLGSTWPCQPVGLGTVIATMSVASSKKSTRSLSVIGGPCSIRGTMFTCIKRCPLCNLTNGEDNVVTGGCFGIEVHEFLVWNRGTSENPVGRHDKLCVRTWDEGGFSAEYADVNEFIIARRGKPVVQLQWDTARECMRIEMGRGPARASESRKAAVADNLEKARKKIVESYEREELEIITGFEAENKDDYEKKFPGRIAERKYKTKWGTFDAVWQEVVLVPKKEQGKWDVNIKQICGVSMITTHDDGSRVIREGQQQAKFQRLGRDLLQDARQCRTNDTADVAFGISELEGPREEDVNDDDAPLDVEDSDGDDGLSFLGAAFGGLSGGQPSSSSAGGSKTTTNSPGKAAPRASTSLAAKVCFVCCVCCSLFVFVLLLLLLLLLLLFCCVC